LKSKILGVHDLMDAKKLSEILQKHEAWLKSGRGNSGQKANLIGADLTNADLTAADLTNANLSGANLIGANLIGANLIGADLTNADLSGADLTDADLSGADLTNADLTAADLGGADLSGADLTNADLTAADLTNADLSGANLSGVKGLLDPIDWMRDNLEKTEEGYIAYKTFGDYQPAPNYWNIKAGAEITEIVNPLPTLDCACGINVATKNWSGFEGEIWKVLIKWEWLPSVVVPYNTDGKFRCGRVKLLEIVS